MNLKIKNLLLDGSIALLVVMIAVVSSSLIQRDGPRSGADFPEDALTLEIQALQARIAKNGDDLYDWMDLASLYKLRGDTAAGIGALERALALPDLIAEQRYALMVRLSEMQLEAGRLKQAWETASSASFINPDRAPAFNRRGDVRYAEDRPIAALDEYETAGRVEPGHAESYALRAGILNQRGDTAGAAKLLEEGLQNSDAENQATARLNLGRHFLKRGQTARAIVAIKAAAKANPRYAGVWAALAAAYEQRADDETRRGKTGSASRSRELAIAAYEKAAALDPRNAAVHERLGDLYARDNRQELAHKSYRAALGYDAENPGLRDKYLATRPSQDLKMAVGDDGAIVITGKSNTQESGNNGVTGGESGADETSPAADGDDSVMVQTTDASGRPVTAALSNLFDSSRRPQADAASLKQRGRDLYLKKKYAQALTEFNRAADADPRDAEARYLSGRTYAQLGRQEAAGEAYEHAIRLAPEDYRSHYHLGELHYQYRQYSDASQAFNNALKVKPDLHTARYNLALSQTKSKQTNAAIKTYRELLRKEPQRWQAALNLAILLKQKN
ncbi:MAG: tetratricopeptide repeat protein, partial [Leptospirales bacterium]